MTYINQGNYHHLLQRGTGPCSLVCTVSLALLYIWYTLIFRFLNCFQHRLTYMPLSPSRQGHVEYVNCFVYYLTAKKPLPDIGGISSSKLQDTARRKAAGVRTLPHLQGKLQDALKGAIYLGRSPKSRILKPPLPSFVRISKPPPRPPWPASLGLPGRPDFPTKMITIIYDQLVAGRVRSQDTRTLGLQLCHTVTWCNSK